MGRALWRGARSLMTEGSRRGFLAGAPQIFTSVIEVKMSLVNISCMTATLAAMAVAHEAVG
jgi:hypothetical protein